MSKKSWTQEQRQHHSEKMRAAWAARNGDGRSPLDQVKDKLAGIEAEIHRLQQERQHMIDELTALLNPFVAQQSAPMPAVPMPESPRMVTSW